MFDLTHANIFNSPTDIAAWAETTRITSLDVRPEGLALTFDKKATWPDQVTPGWDGPLQYTLWIFEQIDGEWCGSGIVEFWRDLAASGGAIYAGNQIAVNWCYDANRWGPMAHRQPAPGEQVGFMVSAGDARNNFSNLHERSNVVLVPFPSAPQTFTFDAAPQTPTPPAPVPPAPPVADPQPPPAPVPPVTADQTSQKLDLILAQLAALNAKLSAATAPIYTGTVLGIKITLTPQK